MPICHDNRSPSIGFSNPTATVRRYGVCVHSNWRQVMANEVSRIWVLMDRAQMQIDLYFFEEAAITIREILVDLAWLAAKSEATECSRN